MKAKNCIAMLIGISFLLGLAHAEPFKSLEYGISFDYADDLKISFMGSGNTPAGAITSDLGADSGITLTGSDGVYIAISKIPITSTIPTLDDLATQFEYVFSMMFPEFKIIGRDDLKIDGKSALDKEYSVEAASGNIQGAIKMRVVYIDRGDCYNMVIFIAEESYFIRANRIYFKPFIKSIEFFEVIDEANESITGFPKYAGAEIWSSPLVADINDDGSLEIVVGTNENELHAWSKDGKELEGFPFKAEDIIAASPAFGDINGDGKGEVVFGSDDGNIYAIDGKGELINGFPKLTQGGIRSSPALGNINGDGILEIVIGSKDTGIYAFGKNGSKVCGFPVITGESSIGGIWSSAAIGDMNGDGLNESIIGAAKLDSALTIVIGDPISYGLLFAVNGTGEFEEGFPSNIGMGNEIGYSSPILADINKDGHLEILAGTTNGLLCLDWEGNEVKGFPLKTDASMQDSFIAVGDLDKDGNLEIVAGCQDGKLYVWKSDGSDYPGFPIQTGGWLRHISLGDINNDGKQEILGGSTDNRVHCYTLDGKEAAAFPKITTGDIETAPTLADLDRDGNLELIVGSNDNGLYVWRLQGKYGELQWPMFRQNVRHAGLVEG